MQTIPLRLFVLFALSCEAGTCLGAGSATAPANDDCSIPLPRVPERMFVITDFGAVADGKTLATDAVRKSLAACATAGGGVVVVPAGEFLTGPFALASSMGLRIDKGATLRFSNDKADFDRRGGRFVDCITADDCHDISITGAGTIDGQGAPWWEEFRKAKAAGVEASLPHRPHLIVFSRCTRVLVRGVQLVNSPMFHLVPKGCRDVAIDGVHITAPEHAPNTDGIDPSGLNFRITHCTINVGDDCIAVKGTGITEAGHPASENFLIADCTFLHGHGMSIGGQTNDGVAHMTVRDCTFHGTQAGIRMKASRGWRAGRGDHLQGPLNDGRGDANPDYELLSEGPQRAGLGPGAAGWQGDADLAGHPHKQCDCRWGNDRGPVDRAAGDADRRCCPGGREDFGGSGDGNHSCQGHPV